MSDMVERNDLPRLINKEMNRYTYVDNPNKIVKQVYMLRLNQGYEI